MSPDECELFPGGTKVPHPLPEEIPEGGFFSFPGMAHAPALIVALTAPLPFLPFGEGREGVRMGPAQTRLLVEPENLPFSGREPMA
ncbi:MAG: hypothetical protein ACYCTV_10305 [Leptospirales bacterium]